MTEQTSFAPRSILLPAILQVDGQAPCFGAIASLSDQGLAFDFQSTPLTQQFVGQTAQLDFDLQDQHHSCKGLIVNIQGQRALLSMRCASPNVLVALQSVNRGNTPSLASRLTTLQVQQSCHTQFMDSMKAVVDTFYQLLSAPPQISLVPQDGEAAPPDRRPLQHLLIPRRPQITRLFTQAYPMHPELHLRFSNASSTSPTDPVDMEQVDDWIRRTTIAQQVVESIQPLPDEFSRHYSLLNSASKPDSHPYQLDAVLKVLADQIAPHKPGPNQLALCYTLMGQAFQKHAIEIYRAMLRILESAPSEPIHQPQHITSLTEWLKISAADSAASGASGNVTITGGGGNATTGAATPIQISKLAALLSRLTENLGELSERLPPTSSLPGIPFTGAPVPGLIARDRVFSHFLPAQAGLTDTGGLLQGNLAIMGSGQPLAASGTRSAAYPTWTMRPCRGCPP